MRNKFIAIIGVTMAIFIAGFFYNRYRVAPQIKFELLELTDLKGNPVNRDIFKGKKLFINFFATWCGSCLQEMSSLKQAQLILAKENFQFITVSDEPVSRLQSFHKQTEIQLMILHSLKNLHEYGIFTIPTSYVLNSNKEIVFTKVGTANWTSSSMIEKLRKTSN